jgi:tetratricopeptide (TPR) repeat protein
LGQSIDLTQQALATDPLRADWYRELANDLFALNRHDEAERAIRKVIELQPTGEGNYTLLSMIEIQRHDAQAALVAAQQEPPGQAQDFALAAARQIGIDQATADVAIRTLVVKYAKANPFGIAEVYALRNDANATFEWLDRAWSNRDPSITILLSDPFLLRYKDDPRFAAFCRKVGLPVPGEAPSHKPG